MAIFYVDTSAIVKRYRREKGTEVIDELLEDPPLADRFYISFLSILELTSAIRRLSEAKNLNKGAAQEILARFHTDVQERFRVWPLDNEIVALAVSLVNAHSLFVSSDRELVDAAQARDLVTLDPTVADALARLAEVRRSEC